MSYNDRYDRDDRSRRDDRDDRSRRDDRDDRSRRWGGNSRRSGADNRLDLTESQIAQQNEIERLATLLNLNSAEVENLTLRMSEVLSVSRKILAEYEDSGYANPNSINKYHRTLNDLELDKAESHVSSNMTISTSRTNSTRESPVNDSIKSIIGSLKFKKDDQENVFNNKSK